jgi:hypothetical protein
MNDTQLEVLTGSLLGDGWLQGHQRPSYYNWKFAKKQKSSRKEYLDWHSSVFGELSLPIAHATQELTFEYYRAKNQKFISESCLFITRADKEFTELGRKWYKNDNGVFSLNKHNRKIKILPEDIALTPLSMAVWFCDDGTNSTKHRTAVFCTNNFTMSECNLLKDKILQTFSIKTTVHTSRSQPMIRIAAADYVNFIDLIKPYVIWPCFQYKITSRQPKFGEQHYRATISDTDIDMMKNLHKKGAKQIDLAKQFGVSRACICNILNGKRRAKI